MIWLFIVKIDLKGNQNHFLFLSKSVYGDVWAKAQSNPPCSYLLQFQAMGIERGGWSQEEAGEDWSFFGCTLALRWGGSTDWGVLGGAVYHLIRCNSFVSATYVGPAVGFGFQFPYQLHGVLLACCHVSHLLLDFYWVPETRTDLPQARSQPPGQAIWQQADIWYVWKLLLPAVLPD